MNAGADSAIRRGPIWKDVLGLDRLNVATQPSLVYPALLLQFYWGVLQAHTSFAWVSTNMSTKQIRILPCIHKLPVEAESISEKKHLILAPMPMKPSSRDYSITRLLSTMLQINRVFYLFLIYRWLHRLEVAYSWCVLCIISLSANIGLAEEEFSQKISFKSGRFRHLGRGTRWLLKALFIDFEGNIGTLLDLN